VADPEEDKLVQLIGLLRLFKDDEVVQKYHMQLDKLRKARRAGPLSVDMVTDEEQLGLAKQCVARATTRLDDTTNTYTNAIQTLARQVVPQQQAAEPTAPKIFTPSPLDVPDVRFDDGLFGFETLEELEVCGFKEPDKEEATSRKQALQQEYKELATTAFGQFATEARELHRQRKAVEERLQKKRKTVPGEAAPSGQPGPAAVPAAAAGSFAPASAAATARAASQPLGGAIDVLADARTSRRLLRVLGAAWGSLASSSFDVHSGDGPLILTAIPLSAVKEDPLYPAVRGADDGQCDGAEVGNAFGELAPRAAGGRRGASSTSCMAVGS
ncbi:unnamed protein product, partial [Prorocentrum cordatum]